MPRLRLPPLPPFRRWHKYFPRTRLSHPPDPKSQRGFRGRFIITNRNITDAFVKDLGIRPNEIVIELFPGTGLLTRSLLNGGNPEDTAGEAAIWSASEKQEKAGIDLDFPLWRKELAKQTFIESSSTPSTIPSTSSESLSTSSEMSSPLSESSSTSSESSATSSEPSTTTSESSSSSDATFPLPRLVIASEPSPEFLIRGLGLPRFERTPSLKMMKGQHTTPVDNNSIVSEDPEISGLVKPPAVSYEPDSIAVHQSSIQHNLLLSNTTPYFWTTVPEILSHELVSSHAGPKRSWNDTPPPITVIAQMPDSSVGDQLVAQWIASVTGAAHGAPSWIWKWGRARLALIVSKTLYDVRLTLGITLTTQRIMSQPREAARSKLSVITNALFHLSPLPPLHHVANVDKTGMFTESRPLAVKKTPSKLSRLLVELLAAEQEKSPRTITYPTDFWPNRTQHDPARPFARTPFLGILFTPRETSLILPEQKDSWDYVLRRCFVRETLPMRDAVITLGFGAVNLVPRLQSTENGFLGKSVDPDKLVRDLEVEEWARVVDVFHRWAFRPDVSRAKRTS